MLATALPAAAAEEINRIVLRINDQIFTLYDYEKRKAVEISRILAGPDTAERQEQLAQIGKGVMQSVFSELLLLSFAKQQSIRVSDSQVAEALMEMQESRGIESEAQMREALARSGMTMEELRENTERDILWSQVVGREVTAKIEVSDEEVRAYYRNHKERFEIPERRWLKEVIVLESDEKSDAELASFAEQVRQQLVADGEIEEVIAPHREQGLTSGLIDLDWLRAGELEETLSEVAWELRPGDFSAPVKGRGGYHILHLAGLEEAAIRPLKEVEDNIRGAQRGARFNTELRAFLAELEQKSQIVEDLPAEAVGYRALLDDYEPEGELDFFHAPIEEPAEEAADSPESEG